MTVLQLARAIGLASLRRLLLFAFLELKYKTIFIKS